LVVLTGVGIAERVLWQTPACMQTMMRQYSDATKKAPLKKATTPVGKLDEKWESQSQVAQPQGEDAQEGDEPEQFKPSRYARFPNDTNPETGEIDGPRGPEPTRYGDWERKGRAIDF